MNAILCLEAKIMRLKWSVHYLDLALAEQTWNVQLRNFQVVGVCE